MTFIMYFNIRHCISYLGLAIVQLMLYNIVNVFVYRKNNNRRAT
jgi:hypothetical protein